SAKGANDAIRVAVVGFGGRGAEHIREMRGLANKNVRIAALCDVDSKILNAGVESFAKRNEKVERYTDIRRLLENKDVDAITIATPNHWHSLATIWAVQAGKDVYVEKPVSHNVWEGRKAVEAARKHGKIVQTGTQSRSSNGIKEAIEWVRAGNLGKINIARGLCYKRRPSIGKTVGPQPVPDYIDYDLWCGPAPLAPPRRNGPKNGPIHYDWHWFWDYGCGDLGNQGIHQMDIARWFLGEDALSPRVASIGGRLGYEDDGETPNTQFVFHDYEKAPLIFEVRGLPEKTDLNADILQGHLSSALCHTGNVSYRLGHQANPDEIRERIKGEKDALETFERMAEHLAANGVDLTKTKATIGVALKMDPGKEQFLGNGEANKLLTRDYRKPFVVPEKV